MCDITNSLLYKVYRARYFPLGNFFEIMLGHNPSYAWCVICEAKKVIFKGRIQGVDDGKYIKIWSKPWVPSFDQLGLHTSIDTANLRETTIKSLMDEHSQLDVQKLMSFFNSRIMSEIFKIRLSQNCHNDT